MIPGMRFSVRILSSKLLQAALALGLLYFGAIGSLLQADPAPGAPPPPAEDFGHYLVDHQDDLAPFFSKNSGQLVGLAVPQVLAWIAKITFIALLVGWAVDVLLARGFAMLFAPFRAQLVPSFIYATVRLILGVVFTILMGLLVISVSGFSHLATILVIVGLAAVLIRAAAQIGWIYYFYRTDWFIALLFYLTLVVVHGFIALAITAPLIGAHAGSSATAFIDQTVVPKLEEEAKATRQELATADAARDQTANADARLQDQIDQAKAEQTEVQAEIEQQKNSEAYLFSQIVKVHARGDLTNARDRFIEFLARFPNGPMTGLAKGQLTQVRSELAAQETQKKQETAAALQAAAQARADLLARAAKGQVTLSEMRLALIGKSRQEVSALLGPPTETASDRWGFSQRMILNPLTNDRSGLTVYFSEGNVQGVDYYYGAPK
jgi:hypothetical protein